jgi:enoyl-CoA hydratase
MAQQIARFPQGAMLADRKSAIAGHGLPVRESLAREWEGGVRTIATEGAAGAGRFAAGKGRGGDFGDI